MSGASCVSASVQRLCADVVPVLHGAVDPGRMMAVLEAVVEQDRWNSFDRFHTTAEYLLTAYRSVGVGCECYRIQTGGGIGDGRWVIPEAADVRHARIDVLTGGRRRIVDYSANPWQVIQWGGSTPSGGLDCDLTVVDSWDELSASGPDRLRGKCVLSGLSPYHHAHLWSRAGVCGVIVDTPVAGFPEAVAWSKFGWGGLPLEHPVSPVVGCAVSAATGQAIRALIRTSGGTVRVHVDVDVRRYAGAHEVVSGIVRGAEDPQDEVWAIAHSFEPGAIDNASGVACCVEMAAVLEGLIRDGALRRPRRSIRFVSGFECYGLFEFISRRKHLQPPLAGICVDCVGARPEDCDRTLRWHRTVPSSAGFVDEVGPEMLRAAMTVDDAGYRLAVVPFVSTEDTMIGDPAYGFPCPYIGNHPYRGYHTSADVPARVHVPGLRTVAAGTAAYLYFLADAASGDALALARWHTRSVARDLADRGESHGSGRQLAVIQHGVSMRRLERWFWGGDRCHLLAELAECKQRIAEQFRPAIPCESARRMSLTPRRRRALAPDLENIPAETVMKLRQSGVHKWALYWADGTRSLRAIARLAREEQGNAYTDDAILEFFEAMAQIGYVELIDPANMVSRERLVSDLIQLGVAEGMDLMVHSSLSAIGHVAGGAETVVEALLEVIGNSGTLLMPSFNHRAARVFNPMTTPTTNGAIPDAMWRRRDAVRSVHPTHSVAAIGPKSAEWCAGHLEKGVWDERSPIGQLVHNGGHILALGVDHTTSTAYHVAEISMDPPCLDQFGSVGRIVDTTGAVCEVPALAWRNGVCPVPPARLSETLDARSLQRRGKVGEAESCLVRALDLWHVRREHLTGVCPTCPVRPLED